jgi:undecaprenyl-diphosphatase
LPPGTVVVVTAVSGTSWWQVVVLAVVQGLTEFLPVSSSGHLAIVSRIFFAGDAGASFTGPQPVVATLIAFGIGLAAVAWLLRFLVRHSMDWFVAYRVLVGGALLILLGRGTVCAT